MFVVVTARLTSIRAAAGIGAVLFAVERKCGYLAIKDRTIFAFHLENAPKKCNGSSL